MWFAVAGHLPKPLDIVAVLTDDTDWSNVLRGENNGRLLFAPEPHQGAILGATTMPL